MLHSTPLRYKISGINSRDVIGPGRRQVVGAILLLLVQPACGSILFDDRCGQETRETVARGDIRDPSGMLLGTAEIQLVEIRRDPDPQRLRVIMMGPAQGSAGAPLRGTISHARLLATSGEILFEIPAQPGVGDEVLRTYYEPIEDRAVFDTLKSHFLSRGAMLELETTRAGQERLRIQLPFERATRWDRARCS